MKNAAESAVEPACLTGLDALETSGRLDLDPTREQERLFGPAFPLQRRVIRAFVADGLDDLRTRAGRMADCCRFPYLATTTDARVAACLGRCRDRACPLCATIRGRYVADQLVPLVRAMAAPKFLTLTLKAEEASLSERITRVIRCFRDLRKHRCWKGRVRGGVYTIEAKWSRDHRSWHAHVHVLLDSDFIPHAQIKAAWAEITSDSFIVHIRPVTDPERDARYVAKYATKPEDFSRWTADRICEWARGMHRRRLLSTFGELHGASVKVEPEEPESKLDTPLGGVARLRRAALNGCRAMDEVTASANALGGKWRILLGDAPCDGERLEGRHLADEEERFLDALMRTVEWVNAHDEDGKRIVTEGDLNTIGKPPSKHPPPTQLRLWTEHVPGTGL